MNPLIIFTFLANPLQWLLDRLTTGFSGVAPLASIGAFGLAVIVTTIVIRAVLFPIFNWQLRTSRRIQAEQRRVAPQIQELRKKYKKEPQKLSAEMNKVYREHGISPFSGLTGCLPAIVQMPVLIGLYNAIRNATHDSVLAAHPGDKGFLWIKDVSLSAQQACCPHGNWSLLLTNLPLLILPLLAGAFTFAQSRMMMPPPRPDMTDQERSMQAVTKQMSLLFPVMIIIFALLFPQGLAIYWVTGTLFMVLQQFYIVGWGGLKVPVWWPGANRVTALSYPKAQPVPALVAAKDSQNGRAAARAGRDGSAAEGSNGAGAEGAAAREAAPAAAGASGVRSGAARSAAARARERNRRRRRR